MAKQAWKAINNSALRPVQNDGLAVRNGLNEALFGTNNPFGGITGQGAQVSQWDTLYSNLRYYLISNNRTLLSQCYAEIGLIQTVVDLPIDDGLRGGIKIKSKQLSEEEIQELETAMDRDDDLGIMGQALKWNRLFGGAGVLIITDQDPCEPLDLDDINPDSKLEFRAVDMWELFFDKQNLEGSAYEGSPLEHDFECYNYYGKKVHKTRVLKLKGREAPSFIRPRLRGWGLSEVETLIRSINQYMKAVSVTFEVLDEFKVDVYRIKNLVTTLLAPGGDALIQKRIQMANQQKNYQSAIALDAEDEYSQKQLSFSGIGEAMEGIRMQVASDVHMPLTKLFGVSSAGFSSGEDDIENYNANIESSVRNKSKHHLLRMIEIKCKKLFDFMPDDLSIEFKPLRVLSGEQEETVKTQKHARLLAARERGEISSFEYKQACNKENLLGIQVDANRDTLPMPNETRDVTDSTKEPGANKVASRTTALPSPKKSTTTAPPSPTARNSLRKEFNASTEDVRKLENFAYQAITNPGSVDEGLWKKAKQKSMSEYGEIRWAFVAWLYKQMGGTFK